jgi:acetylornithine deacetylase/succinyl-diaminopimelate desuccinylase-like protein
MNDRVANHVEQHRDDFVDRLLTLLKIPSISTASEYRDDVHRACQFVLEQFEGMGLEAQILETAGHPAVFADSGPSDGPTVLVYGHYDVQPTGELSLWDSPPFEPTVRDGAIFARGSADDKGQALCHVFAAEAWKKSVGTMPCRVKFLIEGEEEIGSPSLEPLVEAQRDRLACDVVLLSDTSKLSVAVPAITYGTKGLVYKDIKITGPQQALHSGVFGGTVANPGNVIAALVAAMKEESGRVAIPGFYDDVVELRPEERAGYKDLPFDDAEYLAGIGSPALDGEAGFTTLERKWARPTLDVNGLYGGYAGEGAMTVIPAMCGAKVSMRIVPTQDAERVSAMFDAFVRERCPATVNLQIDTHGVAEPYCTPLDLPALSSARAAVEDGYGVAPAMIREGGTIPIMALFRRLLGAESVLMGFSDPNCNLHGPNEFFHIDDFVKGIRSSAAFFERFAAV